MMRKAFVLPLVLLAVPAAAQAPATLSGKEAILWQALERRVAESSRALEGVLGVAVRDLRTGATIQLNAEDAFPQASSIKLAVLYELYLRAERGDVDLAEGVPLRDGPRAGSAGVVRLLGPQARLSWRDLAVLMMALSDNEATNMLIDRVSLQAVNRRLDGLGLSKTRLKRRMMDLAAAQRGDENVSTPAEMLALIQLLHEGRGLSPERARDLRQVAAVEKQSAFRLPLPEGLTVLDKPGELEGVRCVTALVELPRRPYAAAIMTTFLHREADGDAVIRDLSAAIYGVFDRLDRGAETGRLLGGR